MKKGTLVKLKIPCLGNPIGTKGICFDVINIEEGVNVGQVIFKNGEHCGFDKEEVDIFFDIISESALEYQFVNVIKLDEDYEAGVFSQILE